MGMAEESERELDKEMLGDNKDKGEHRAAVGGVRTEEDVDVTAVGLSAVKESAPGGKRPRGRNAEEGVHDRTVAQSMDAELIADSEDFEQSVVESDEDSEPEDDEVRDALKKEQIVLSVVEHRHFEKRPAELVHYRYLCWACFRGHVHVAYYILKQYRISPFLAGSD